MTKIDYLRKKIVELSKRNAQKIEMAGQAYKATYQAKHTAYRDVLVEIQHLEQVRPLRTGYYIFKTDNKSGVTQLICNGSHDTKEECEVHWRCYMYGWMDAALGIVGPLHLEKSTTGYPMAFRYLSDTHDMDYFMLLDEQGRAKVYEISK